MSAEKHLSLRDAPAKTRDNDQLNLKEYAEVLAEFAQECETPLTIGIQGDWGIGKTSLLYMIRERLESTRGKNNFPVPYIDINTWQYSMFGQEEYLPIACLQAMIDQISDLTPEESYKAKISEVAGKTGKTIARIASSMEIGFMGASVNLAAAKEAQTEGSVPDYQDLSQAVVKLKDEFQALVKEAIDWQKEQKSEESDRLVIFIDDLDRVKPIRALELLEVLKNFLDVPGCVFFLAVDYEVIRMGMRQKFGQEMQESNGKSFFDKIINVPFNMPTTSYSLGKYIIELLRESGFSRQDLKASNKRARQFFERVTSVTVGRNPRNIKRVINYAKLLDKIRSKGVAQHEENRVKSHEETQLLYALMCMQIAYPELFEYFAEHPTAETIQNLEKWEFLETLPQGRRAIARADDEAQVKSDIGAFVDELFGLIDKDGNGQITHKEMEPVLEVMRLARLTQATTAKTPLEQLITAVEENGSPERADFLMDIYKRSKWHTRPEADLTRSGVRYWTITMKRRQVGSLVTLKGNNDPRKRLIFRLKHSADQLLQRLERLSKQAPLPADADAEKIIAPLTEFFSESTTGFGDSVLDLDYLIEQITVTEQMKVTSAVRILNLLYEATYQIEFPAATLQQDTAALNGAITDNGSANKRHANGTA